MNSYEKFEETLKANHGTVYISAGELLFLLTYRNEFQVPEFGKYLGKSQGYIRSQNNKNALIDVATAERLTDLFETSPYNETAFWTSDKLMPFHAMEDIPFIDEDKHPDLFAACSNSQEARNARMRARKEIRDAKKLSADNKSEASTPDISRDLPSLSEWAEREKTTEDTGQVPNTGKASPLIFLHLLSAKNELPNARLIKLAEQNETLPDAVAAKLSKLFKQPPFNSTQFWQQSEFDVSPENIPFISNAKASAFYRVTQAPKQSKASSKSTDSGITETQGNELTPEGKPIPQVGRVNYEETVSATYPFNINKSYLNRS